MQRFSRLLAVAAAALGLAVALAFNVWIGIAIGLPFVAFGVIVDQRTHATKRTAAIESFRQRAQSLDESEVSEQFSRLANEYGKFHPAVRQLRRELDVD
ncbi:MAG: hypothetical protein ACPHCI_07115 [Solirubrobacterales bacterium]